MVKGISLTNNESLATERSGPIARAKTDYLEGFLDFCKFHRNLSENTLRSYRFDLEEYLKWLEDRGLELSKVKIREIDSYIIWLRKERGNSIQSTNRKMYALKGFYRWLLRIEAIDRSPLELFQNVRSSKPLPKYLTEEQQEALLEASQNGNHRDQWITQRDHLLVLLLLSTGLRISEAVGIEIKNINLSEGILRVRGKGNKEREVVLSDRLIRTIKEYLKTIDRVELKDSVPPGLCHRGFSLSQITREVNVPASSALTALHEQSKNSNVLDKLQAFVEARVKPLNVRFLFANEHGKPLGTRHAFRIIRAIGQRAGIADLYPHALRHTFATNLRKKNCDLQLIQEALGHSSIATTQIYAHLGDGEYRERLKRLVN